MTILLFAVGVVVSEVRPDEAVLTAALQQTDARFDTDQQRWVFDGPHGTLPVVLWSRHAAVADRTRRLILGALGAAGESTVVVRVVRPLPATCDSMELFRSVALWCGMASVGEPPERYDDGELCLSLMKLSDSGGQVLWIPYGETDASLSLGSPLVMTPHVAVVMGTYGVGNLERALFGPAEEVWSDSSGMKRHLETPGRGLFGQHPALRAVWWFPDEETPDRGRSYENPWVDPPDLPPRFWPSLAVETRTRRGVILAWTSPPPSPWRFPT